MSDRFGRRPVLALSQLGSAIGYLLLGIATLPWFGWSPRTMLTLVYLSRMLDGFTGGNVSTAQAYISDITTPKTRAKGMGMLGAAFGIGFVVGPIMGGILGSIKLHGSDFVALPAYAAMLMSGERRRWPPGDIFPRRAQKKRPPTPRSGSIPGGSRRSCASPCWPNCWSSRSSAWRVLS